MDGMVVNNNDDAKIVAKKVMGEHGSFDTAIGPNIVEELKKGRLFAINCVDEYTCFLKWDERE